MRIRHGDYVAELAPRIDNVRREQNVYQITIYETKGEPSSENYLTTDEAYADGFDEAVKRAEEILAFIVDAVRGDPKS